MSGKTMFVLDAFVKHLMEEHKIVQSKIDEVMRLPHPDGVILTRLKKQKLRIKDAAQEYVNKLPKSQFAPILPALFALSDEDLQKKIVALGRDINRKENSVGPTASCLHDLRARLREAEMERDRREWDAMTIDEAVDIAA